MSVFAWLLVSLILYVCCGALTALWACDSEPLPGIPPVIIGVLWPSVIIGFVVATFLSIVKGGRS